MFTKIILISAATTGILGTGALGGAIGTGAATGYTPSGVEFAVGTVRVEAGNGKMFSAHMAAHAPFTLTISLQDESQLQIKF